MTKGLQALAAWWRAWRTGASRALTPGEAAIAQAVFGDAIHWPAVRIYARGFTPFQPKRTAVAPNGHIYFRPEDHRADFSGTWQDGSWLIHELTHVWQHHAGVHVLPRGLWERTYRYGQLDPGRRFTSYGIEQQAAIVEDWFRITCGISPWRGTGAASDYRAVLPFGHTGRS